MSLSPGLDPLQRRATVEVVADALRGRIIDGTFAPGSQLGEVQLAAQLGVSRGPVREALQRLIQEGLLVGRPHRGVFVIELDEDDVADVYLARGAVERAAADLVVGQPDEVRLRPLVRLVERMAAAAERGRWVTVVSLDRRFHQALVDAAGSPRLTRMYGTLMAETAICIGALESAYPVRRELVEEHAGLLDALQRGDGATVRARIDEHLAQAVAHLRGRAGEPGVVPAPAPARRRAARPRPTAS